MTMNLKVKYLIESNTYLIDLGFGAVYELTSDEFKKLYASMIDAYVAGLGEPML